MPPIWSTIWINCLSSVDGYWGSSGSALNIVKSRASDHMPTNEPTKTKDFCPLDFEYLEMYLQMYLQLYLQMFLHLCQNYT